MVTLIVSTNEAYLGWIMYLALQMQPSIHLPRHMSHRIRSKRQKESFSPSAEQLGLKNKFQRPSWPGQGLVGTLTGVTALPSMARSCQRTRSCSTGVTGPAQEQPPPQLPVHLPYFLLFSSISSYSSPRGGSSGSQRWQEAVTLPWTSPLLPSLLPASFPGTLLELRTNCNYFSR